MRRLMGRGLVVQAMLAGLLAVGACNKSKNNEPAIGGPNPQMGGGPWQGRGGPGGPPSPLGKAMIRLGKGPNSLTESIGRELKTDPPPWDAIGPEAKEYAQLAGSLNGYDPPKGSKESWTKLTAAYAESASALDRAATAKDKTAAVAAHSALRQSCMACHREHRPGPGGMRGGPPAPR